MAESQFPVSFTPVDGVEWQSVRNEFTSAATVAVDQSHILSANSKWGDYLDCYWRHFHPLFPILHYNSTLTNPPPPALAVLMIIIGAQFSTLPASKNHSMGMYDSYVRLFSTVSLLMQSEDECWTYKGFQQMSVTASSCLSDMQTIFLLEAFHRYRAREARLENIPMSSQFRALYSSVSR